MPLTPGVDGDVDPGAVLAGLMRRGKREADFYREYTSASDHPARGRRVPAERLERVAALYRQALIDGFPPTQTIADEMHVTRPTASRWVAKARERGLLGAATPGKAGEK